MNNSKTTYQNEKKSQSSHGHDLTTPVKKTVTESASSHSKLRLDKYEELDLLHFFILYQKRQLCAAKIEQI